MTIFGRVPKWSPLLQELLPYDNYCLMTTFWPCPEVVTISDNQCTSRSGKTTDPPNFITNIGPSALLLTGKLQLALNNLKRSCVAAG